MSLSGWKDRTADFPRVTALSARIAWAVVALLVGGCSTLPADYPRLPSEAVAETAETRLGRSLAPKLLEHPGLSGFLPLGNGLDAFVARLALAEMAERTLDVQYYLFHDDATGRLLAAHLVRAADRGVRVRLLLDDMDMGGRDAGLAAVASHPNIEVRLFNPFPSRTMRVLNFLSHFGTVTRRMHNKSFTADNQVTIVGGRNIGDEYFEAAEGVNFGDMDVWAVGPVVREVSSAFDRYWNSDLAFPVTAFDIDTDPALVARARERLAQEIETLPGTAYGRRLQEASLTQRLEAGELDLYWATSRLLYDLPEKVRTDPDDRSTHLGPELGELLAAVETDLILVSPYFVPGRDGAALLRSLVERGCRVTVLTNSLAATDVPAVHAGYARYRRGLLEAGVELYEMRPTATTVEAQERRFGESQASLHAKTLVFDRESVLVGSMNLDPRSNLLNTEMGILIESPELAELVAQWRETDLPEVAWRVELEPGAGADSPGSAGYRLVWTGLENGQPVRRHDKEPDAGLWERFQAFIFRVLPVERQL